MVQETKNLTEKEISVHMLCPFLVGPPKELWVPLGIGKSV